MKVLRSHLHSIGAYLAGRERSLLLLTATSSRSYGRRSETFKFRSTSCSKASRIKLEMSVM